MATLGGSFLTSPARGAARDPFFPRAPAATAPARSTADERPLRRDPVSIPRSGRELRGAVVLAVGWILLWAYFVVGVAEQAAAFRAAAARPAGADAPAETAGTMEVRALAPRVLK